MKAEEVKPGVRVRDCNVAHVRLGTIQSDVLIRQGKETCQVLFNGVDYQENRQISQLKKMN